MISLSAWHTESTAAHNAQLAELLRAVYAADGRPLVDSGSVPADFLGGEQLLAFDGELLTGFLRLDTAGDAFGRPVAELYVHPEHRGEGIGGRLLTELLRRLGLAGAAKDRVRIWAHGDSPAAARLAARFGLARVRELHRMRMKLDGVEIAAPVLPQGVRLRSFVPGTDEQAVVAVNRRAFDWHPEQSAFSLADLLRAENADWFDPQGFFLAESDSRLLGFHWTKVHRHAVGDSSGLPMGEVYVVGVDPGAQGGGLGKALTAAGLLYLRERGLHQVMLYVESDNSAAIRVYERLGFAIWDTDVQYAK